MSGKALAAGVSRNKQLYLIHIDYGVAELAKGFGELPGKLKLLASSATLTPHHSTLVGVGFDSLALDHFTPEVSTEAFALANLASRCA